MLPAIIRHSQMLLHIIFLLAVAAALPKKAPDARPYGPTLTSDDLGLSFKATFSTAIAPFNASVDEAFLNMTTLKASLTRFVDDTPGQLEFTDGPPKRVVQNIASFWGIVYSWGRVEADINSRFRQFTSVSLLPSSRSPIPRSTTSLSPFTLSTTDHPALMRSLCCSSTAGPAPSWKSSPSSTRSPTLLTRASPPST